MNDQRIDVTVLTSQQIHSAREEGEREGSPFQNVVLHRIRVNRAESGSPNWKNHYYLSQQAAISALRAEPDGNSLPGGTIEINADFDQRNGGRYYIV